MRALLLLPLLTACAAEPVAFQTVSDNVIAGCAFSSCHGSGTGGLTLDGSAEDHTRLLSGESVTGVPYVVPGDPDASYLVHKLEGGPDIEGELMPPGTPLDEETINLVRDWIAEGAGE
ncbi:hypothetical protein L6R49_30405 [Myxococcota bacterium]|nr:hypothetical protein [Myxococcota bacterium]